MKSLATLWLEEFHEAAPHQVEGADLAWFRATLIAEECEEAQQVLGDIAAPGEAEDDELLGQLARELADIIYVAYGAAHAYGIDLDAALRQVHRANMTKANGPRREDGKLMKPEGFIQPDMTSAIEQAYLR